MARRATQCSMGYRTTIRTPTGETPFKLAYGSESVISAEVPMASHRVKEYQAKKMKYSFV